MKNVSVLSFSFKKSSVLGWKTFQFCLFRLRRDLCNLLARFVAITNLRVVGPVLVSFLVSFLFGECIDLDSE